ncbi:MAG: tripartite tricarboxylate transporter TctB family protein [Mailhella sp.]|nr:tripartite tricarboxylate transporter TctB family protein [Mailhella sp.]
MTKEFAAALTMSGIIAFFAWQVNEPTEEYSRLAPIVLLVVMGALNILQYLHAFVCYQQKVDDTLTLKGYPLKRVVILFLLTAVFIFSAEWLGFYLASFLYFFIVSVIAQPMPITPRGLAKRFAIVLACVLFLYVLFTVTLKIQIPMGICKF